MCKGRSVVSFFPAVTNCLSSSAYTVRSLVAVFIVRYAAQEPDLALLSVNTFQKDLSDPNPALRALALRTLAGLSLEPIAGLVMLSLKRAARDSAWHVRRTAAAVCASVVRLDPSAQASIVSILSSLLVDRSALVAGAAAAAFAEICPHRTDVLHPAYRALCRILVDADEWGQLAIMKVLAAYARANFLNPDLNVSALVSDVSALRVMLHYLDVRRPQH